MGVFLREESSEPNGFLFCWDANSLFSYSPFFPINSKQLKGVLSLTPLGVSFNYHFRILWYILLFSICEIWLFNSSSGTLHLIICFVRFCLKMGLAGPHGLYVLGSVH